MAIKQWDNLEIDYPTQDVKGYEAIMEKFKEFKISIDISVSENTFQNIRTNNKGEIFHTLTSLSLNDEEIWNTIIQYFEWLSNHRKNINLLKGNGF